MLLLSPPQVKAFAATRVAGAHWLGNVQNDPLQRVYGISFPEKRQLVDWEARQAEVRVRARAPLPRARGRHRT